MYTKQQSGFIGTLIIILVLGVIIFNVVYKTYATPPKNFPTPYTLRIEQGQTLFSISEELYKDNVIRSPRLFEIAMVSLGSEKNISEGEYYFSEPMNVVRIAMRISGKDFGIDREKITFPEGFTNKEIADRLLVYMPQFNADKFLQLAKPYEGYLFPDTYRFFPSVTPEDVVKTLRENFDVQMETIAKDFASSKYSEEQIIIMASIIEKEANGPEDRKMVSGILWKRFEQGMPLQVDAPFLYLIGKESSELTRQDLAMKSPYNTYINKGLPPTPINNPGMDSIKAALYPQASPYLFYLHDDDGKIYYARTYDEHKKNIDNYLR